MESFGAILREAREARGLDLNRVSADTNISAVYLDALEKELITKFPADTYLVGFMRTYAEYLNLSPESLIELYHAVKMQIAPVPEALLQDKKKSVPWYAIIGGTFVALIAIVVIVLVVLFNAKRSAQHAEVVIEKQKAKTYQLGTAPMEKRLYIDDTIEVSLGDESVSLVVVDTLGVLTLKTPFGTQVIELGEETEIDLNGEPGGEVSLFVSDISERDAERGVEIQMIRISDVETPIIVQTDIEEEDVEVELNTQVVKVSDSRTVIFEGNTAYPVSINATFRGPCLFRYEVDKKETIEDFLSTGETVNFSANNGARVWMTNANAVKVQVIGGGKKVDLEIGRPGQVLVQDIKWVRDEDGKYRLVVLNVD